ncbi:MAG: YXWGXW repeat-containing protein [Usitatibacter sp.]
MKMKTLISTGFATVALAGAAIPALAWNVYPDVDFQWYANVGKAMPGMTIVEATPAPREGYIWSPGHWETRGTHQNWIGGAWVKDDYQQQLTVYNNANGTTTYATGPLILRDSQGNVIPTQPDAYSVGSARK